jgi:4-hydroxybenzoate polyprenyltransferase
MPPTGRRYFCARPRFAMETITSEQPIVPEPDQPEQPAADEPVVPRRSPLRAAIKTGRPKEWVKNVFVFAGLLFSGKFNQSHDVFLAVVTFVSFCLISSAGYYVNDLIDVELDRKHPKKKFRPLAAGELSEGLAKAIAPVLAAIAIAIAFLVNWQVGLMVVGYGVAQVAYSLGLKQIVIIDVMTLAGLFILRVAAGASAVDAHASEWLILCTGMLAAFLGFTKRRQEAVSEIHEGTSTRPVLEHYSLPFLDQMVSLVTTGTVLSYAIYTVNSPIVGSQMMLTIPPVVYAIFRYLYLIYDRNDDRSMSGIIAGDRGIQGALLAFALVAFAVLYVFN